MNEATNQQPLPTKSSGPDCWKLVIQDMEERRKFGIEKYGEPLRPFNGRDALTDLVQEQLDQIVYTKQAILERDEIATRLLRGIDAFIGAPIIQRNGKPCVGLDPLEAEMLKENLCFAVGALKGQEFISNYLKEKREA